VWVLENPPGKGLHLHAAVHVPADRQSTFIDDVKHWMNLLGATPDRDGAVDNSPIEFARQPYHFPPGSESRWYLKPGFGQPRSRRGPKGWLGYMLKGAEPDICRTFGIHHEPGGRVTNKRCSASQAINVKARSSYRLPSAKPGSRQCPRRWALFTQRMLSYQGFTRDADYQVPLD
jgi:hypothetical protein